MVKSGDRIRLQSNWTGVDHPTVLENPLRLKSTFVFSAAGYLRQGSKSPTWRRKGRRKEKPSLHSISPFLRKSPTGGENGGENECRVDLFSFLLPFFSSRSDFLSLRRLENSPGRKPDGRTFLSLRKSNSEKKVEKTNVELGFRGISAAFSAGGLSEGGENECRFWPE